MGKVAAWMSAVESYGDFQATAIRWKTARLDAPDSMFQLAG
jgi:hypothetical protein